MKSIGERQCRGTFEGAREKPERGGREERGPVKKGVELFKCSIEESFGDTACHFETDGSFIRLAALVSTGIPGESQRKGVSRGKRRN